MKTPITTKPSSMASRLKSFGVVHAALTIQSGLAVNELAYRQAAALAACRAGADEPTLHDMEGTGYHEIFSHLAGELETAKVEMISANSSHLGQLALIVDLKERRENLTDVLSGRFFKARHTFETLYGTDKRFPVLAVSGDTPADPTGLVSQVRETAGFLAEPKVEPPAFDLDGVALDPPSVAVHLASGADELDGVLVDINEAEKQADVTRQGKNEAIDSYDRKFLRVARVAESLFHFAGLHALAERVRPSNRRPGRRVADEGSDADEAAETESGDTQAVATAGEQAETGGEQAETGGESEAEAPPAES